MSYKSDVKTWEQQGLRVAITGGDLVGDDAYRELIKFDEELSADYGGFMEACQRVGLSVISERAYNKIWREIEIKEE
jgi:hypothetical protein